MNKRRIDGTYKIEQRDFIDVFLNEIDAHAEDKSENNFYTGLIPYLYYNSHFLCMKESTIFRPVNAMYLQKNKVIR